MAESSISMKIFLLLFLAQTAAADMTFDKWQYDMEQNHGVITVKPEVTYGSLGIDLYCSTDGTCRTLPRAVPSPKPIDYSMRCWTVGGAYTRCENDEIICYSYGGIQCRFK